MNGEPVIYGSCVELEHVKSSKLLCVVKKSVAALDKSCSLVGLRGRNGTACFFRVLPRFKHRCEGQRVVVGDQCTLVAAKTGLAVHLSERTFEDAPGAREVNAGTLSTALRLAPFSDYHPRGGLCINAAATLCGCTTRRRRARSRWTRGSCRAPAARGRRWWARKQRRRRWRRGTRACAARCTSASGATRTP